MSVSLQMIYSLPFCVAALNSAMLIVYLITIVSADYVMSILFQIPLTYLLLVKNVCLVARNFVSLLIAALNFVYFTTI